MIKDIIDKTVTLMQKKVDMFLIDLDKMRIGRANPKLISSIKIIHCNNETLLEYIATINSIDNNVVIVTPFDKNMLLEIDKVIRGKNLNLSSVVSRDSIKIIFPPLSLEGRQKLIKFIAEESEANKISIRNIRRDAKNNLQILFKNKSITLDEEKAAMKMIQKMTDKFIDDITNIVKNKNKELLNI
ncbi:MAG: ribosome recycling factor [Candidatus Azosocius agrarius]|nr:MAG: ribosome recycling factor [Gammaproteobacteria bacterium]